MVRPRIKNGRQIQFYLSEDTISALEEYSGKMSMSAFIEQVIKWAIQGGKYGAELIKKNAILEEELKEAREENELLRKRNRALMEELAKMKAKYGNIAQLDRGKQKWIVEEAFLEQVCARIKEGRTLAEVLSEVGVDDYSEQLQFFKKYFRGDAGDVARSYHPLFKEWELRRNGTEQGYPYYTFFLRAGLRRKLEVAEVEA